MLFGQPTRRRPPFGMQPPAPQAPQPAAQQPAPAAPAMQSNQPVWQPSAPVNQDQAYANSLAQQYASQLQGQNMPGTNPYQTNPVAAQTPVAQPPLVQQPAPQQQRGPAWLSGFRDQMHDWRAQRGQFRRGLIDEMPARPDFHQFLPMFRGA